MIVFFFCFSSSKSRCTYTQCLPWLETIVASCSGGFNREGLLPRPSILLFRPPLPAGIFISGLYADDIAEKRAPDSIKGNEDPGRTTRASEFERATDRKLFFLKCVTGRSFPLFRLYRQKWNGKFPETGTYSLFRERAKSSISDSDDNCTRDEEIQKIISHIFRYIAVVCETMEFFSLFFFWFTKGKRWKLASLVCRDEPCQISFGRRRDEENKKIPRTTRPDPSSAGNANSNEIHRNYHPLQTRKNSQGTTHCKI